MNYCLILAAAAAFAQHQQQPADPMRAAISRQQASLAIQRESVRRQAASAATWLVPWAGAPPMVEAACDPLPDPVVAPMIEVAAKAQQLEPRLLRAVVERESAFRACAVSPKGAKGLMQLMPATIEQFSVQNPFDPRESVDAGAKYLKLMLDRYHGDLAQALGAYNAGPATVDQAGGVPDIPETRDYVDAILKKLGIAQAKGTQK